MPYLPLDPSKVLEAVDIVDSLKASKYLLDAALDCVQINRTDTLDRIVYYLYKYNHEITDLLEQLELTLDSEWVDHPLLIDKDNL